MKRVPELALAFAIGSPSFCHQMVMHLSCTSKPQVLSWLGTILLLLLTSPMLHLGDYS